MLLEGSVQAAHDLREAISLVVQGYDFHLDVVDEARDRLAILLRKIEAGHRLLFRSNFALLYRN